MGPGEGGIPALDEGLDDVAVELRARHGLEDAEHGLGAVRGAVGAVDHEGAEDVGNGGDVADEQGEGVVELLAATALDGVEAGEAIGVAAAVVALVVLTDDDAGGFVGPLEGTEDAIGVEGVGADFDPLVGGERLGAVQFGREHAHADVAQDHAVGEAAQEGPVQVEGEAQGDGDGGGIDGVVEPLDEAGADGADGGEVGGLAGVVNQVTDGAAEGTIEVPAMGLGEGVGVPDATEEADGGAGGGEEFGVDGWGRKSGGGEPPSVMRTRA